MQKLNHSGDGAERWQLRYAQAESSYGNDLKVMEAMLDKLPPDKAAEIQAKLDAVRQSMKTELGNKKVGDN